MARKTGDTVTSWPLRMIGTMLLPCGLNRMVCPSANSWGNVLWFSFMTYREGPDPAKRHVDAAVLVLRKTKFIIVYPNTTTQHLDDGAADVVPPIQQNPDACSDLWNVPWMIEFHSYREWDSNPRLPAYEASAVATEPSRRVAPPACHLLTPRSRR